MVMYFEISVFAWGLSNYVIAAVADGLDVNDNRKCSGLVHRERRRRSEREWDKFDFNDQSYIYLLIQLVH